MTTQTVEQSEANVFYASVPFSEPISEEAELTQRANGLYIRRTDGLGAAIGAITAISLQLAGGFMVYLAWHFWHLFH